MVKSVLLCDIRRISRTSLTLCARSKTVGVDVADWVFGMQLSDKMVGERFNDNDSCISPALSLMKDYRFLIPTSWIRRTRRKGRGIQSQSSRSRCSVIKRFPICSYLSLVHCGTCRVCCVLNGLLSTWGNCNFAQEFSLACSRANYSTKCIYVIRERTPAFAPFSSLWPLYYTGSRRYAERFRSG